MGFMQTKINIKNFFLFFFLLLFFISASGQNINLDSDETEINTNKNAIKNNIKYSLCYFSIFYSDNFLCSVGNLFIMCNQNYRLTLAVKFC